MSRDMQAPTSILSPNLGGATRPFRPCGVWARTRAPPWGSAPDYLPPIFAPLLTPYDPIKQNFQDLLVGPNPTHWLGTDNYGRDVWSRILYGGRISLTVGSISVVIGTVIGGFGLGLLLRIIIIMRLMMRCYIPGF
jgi:hypothetical protein